MSRRLPPLLTSGSRVRIVSPSGPVTPKNLEHGIATLKSWGLSVELDESVYERAVPGYLAGADDRRVAAINSALSDPSLDAVFFSRGGYGLTRIVHQVTFEPLKSHPKWVIGFSDVTAFHLAAIASELPISTLHGHVVKSLQSQSADAERLRRLLFDGQLPAVKLVHVAGSEASVSGPLVGGNASLVAAMLGSGRMPDLANHILFLEDIGEPDYRLDRLLTSISRSRVAAGLSAVVLGHFTDCHGVYVGEEEFPEFLGRLASEMAATLECPVYTDLPVGHGDRNVPMPIGSHATISESELFIATQP